MSVTTDSKDGNRLKKFGCWVNTNEVTWRLEVTWSQSRIKVLRSSRQIYQCTVQRHTTEFRRLGNLRNDDGDGNENGKKAIGTKQQLCTCITLFCTFLCRRRTTTRWKCLISRWNKRPQLPFSFPELWCSPQLQKKLPTFNELNEMDKVWGSANSIFKWRFRNRRRRRCVNSLLTSGLVHAYPGIFENWGGWGGRREKTFVRLPAACVSHSSLALHLSSLNWKRKIITPVQLDNHSPVTEILYCLSLMKNHYCTRVLNTCKTFKQTNVCEFESKEWSSQ